MQLSTMTAAITGGIDWCVFAEEPEASVSECTSFGSPFICRKLRDRTSPSAVVWMINRCWPLLSVLELKSKFVSDTELTSGDGLIGKGLPPSRLYVALGASVLSAPNALMKVPSL